MSADPLDEAVAARRFMLLGGARLAAIALVVIGLAIVQAAIAAPYWLGVALAGIGLLGFFFGPPLLVRRWKAGDRSEP